jgi:hypothetical protein
MNRRILPIDLYSFNSINYNRYNIINIYYSIININNDSDDSDDSNVNDDKDKKNMTSEEVFTLLGIKVTHKPFEIKEEECPIWGKPDCVTCCNHAFYQESLAKWLRNNKYCPLCRNFIVEINIPPV